MRRLLKCLHTLGAIGLMGSMAALLVMIGVAPPPSSLPAYAAVGRAMSAVATWLFLPSLALTILAGLLAIAANRAFHSAGWAWAKLATGVLVFEGGIQGIQGPIRDDAERAAAALAGHLDPTSLAGSLSSERGTLWVLLAVAAANVALGIWRPRLTRWSD